jgi:hypothetical protein
MAPRVRHSVDSEATDLLIADQIGPDDWNDDHLLTQNGERILGKNDAGEGATVELALGTGLEFNGAEVRVDVDTIATRAYAESLFASNDAMLFKGVIDASANPNYPAADAGHTYKISVAGKIGGGSGPNVEVGDTLYCITDSTSAGTHAAVGANWVIVQTNIDGAVTGPASAGDNNFAQFNGTSGKVIEDSGISFVDEDDMVSDSATKVPSQQSVKAYVDANAGGTTFTASDTAPVAPGDGDEWLNTDTGILFTWVDEESFWVELGPYPGMTSGMAPQSFAFTGDGVETDFDLADEIPGLGAITDANRIMWFEGGLYQRPGVDFTVSGTVVTRGTAPLEDISIFGVVMRAVEISEVAPEQIVGIEADVVALIEGTAGRWTEPCGRLSLASNTPITVSDLSAQATVYYTPYKGNVIPIYDGTRFVHTVFAELSLALDSDSGHTGYHQSGKLFDLFVFNDAGTIRLGTGPAWTNDTTRADAVTRVGGVVVNNASIVLRFGSVAGNTVTVGANLATYVGTFAAVANGQTSDSMAFRLLWNMYNRVPRPMQKPETTNSWNWSTNSFHVANAADTNCLTFVRGLDEDAMKASTAALVNNDTTTRRAVYGAIGLDSQTVPATGCNIGFVHTAVESASASRMAFSTYFGFPGLGFHRLYWLEKGAGADSQTWYGDDGGALSNGIYGECMA